MQEILSKLFTEQLSLSADMWLILLMVVLIVAFAVSLVLGLFVGALGKIKGNMKRAVQKPNTAVVQMKNMPANVKALYKTARMTSAKPSALVTQSVCVDEPYKQSLISKVWLITLVATLICAALAYFLVPFAALPEVKTEEELAKAMVLKEQATFLSPAFLLILGSVLTIVGGVVGKLVYGGAVKTYAKFAPVIDGDAPAAASTTEPAQQAQAAYEPQNEYAAESAYDAQPAYEEQQAYAAEPQDDFNNASYAEPVAMAADAQQESDEEIRRKAREEAIAQARAAQAQAQAQAAQAQAAQKQAAQPASGGSSADDVIAQIEKISREGAPRETMRDVATLLQKERAKPENKTPEQQKRLNEALSKLLKAMSAATKK